MWIAGVFRYTDEAKGIEIFWLKFFSQSAYFFRKFYKMFSEAEIFGGQLFWGTLYFLNHCATRSILGWAPRSYMRRLLAAVLCFYAPFILKCLVV